MMNKTTCKSLLLFLTNFGDCSPVSYNKTECTETVIGSGIVNGNQVTPYYNQQTVLETGNAGELGTPVTQSVETTKYWMPVTTTTTQEVIQTTPDGTLVVLSAPTTSSSAYYYNTPIIVTSTTQEVFQTVPDGTLVVLSAPVTSTTDSSTYYYNTPIIVTSTTQEVIQTTPDGTLVVLSAPVTSTTSSAYTTKYTTPVTTTQEVFQTVPDGTLIVLSAPVTSKYTTPVTTTQEVFQTVPDGTLVVLSAPTTASPYTTPVTTTQEVFQTVPDGTLVVLSAPVTSTTLEVLSATSTTKYYWNSMNPEVTSYASSTTTVETGIVGDRGNAVSSTYTYEISKTWTSNDSTETVLAVSDEEGFPIANNVTEPVVDVKEIKQKDIETVRVSGKDFCSAVGMSNVIANGTQQKFKTCSLTVQGAIPDFDTMVSTVIVLPDNGQIFKLGFANLTIVIVSSGIEYGFFDDPTSLYYFTPQSLNQQGLIKGHNHISVQKLIKGVIPDPRTPVFFKGLNEQSIDGSLNVTVSGDLFTETGIYRICTSTASQSHAPVLMPVAKRGFADDCIRISVQ
jgi:hypothetical protein